MACATWAEASVFRSRRISEHPAKQRDVDRLRTVKDLGNLGLHLAVRLAHVTRPSRAPCNGEVGKLLHLGIGYKDKILGDVLALLGAGAGRRFGLHSDCSEKHLRQALRVLRKLGALRADSIGYKLHCKLGPEPQGSHWGAAPPRRTCGAWPSSMLG